MIVCTTDVYHQFIYNRLFTNSREDNPYSAHVNRLIRKIHTLLQSFETLVKKGSILTIVPWREWTSSWNCVTPTVLYHRFTSRHEGPCLSSPLPPIHRGTYDYWVSLPSVLCVSISPLIPLFESRCAPVFKDKGFTDHGHYFHPHPHSTRVECPSPWGPSYDRSWMIPLFVPRCHPYRSSRVVAGADDDMVPVRSSHRVTRPSEW